jgi:hypothetical protein
VAEIHSAIPSPADPAGKDIFIPSHGTTVELQDPRVTISTVNITLHISANENPFTNFSLHDLQYLETVRCPFPEINPKAFISSNGTKAARPKGYSYKFLII